MRLHLFLAAAATLYIQFAAAFIPGRPNGSRAPIAEEVFFHSVSTGASHDLEQARKLAEEMITTYGMGSKAVHPSASNKYREVMDSEIDGLIDTAYRRATFLVTMKRDAIEKCARKLAEKHTMSGEEVMSVIGVTLARSARVSRPPDALGAPDDKSHPIIYTRTLMANFVQIFSEKMRPYGRTLLIIALFIIFGVLGYFLYGRVMKPVSTTVEKGYDDIANRDKNLGNTCEILFFNAIWCPFCVKSKPEWNKFADEYNGKVINNRKILCKNIDCSNEDDENANAMLQKFQVDAYPTVKAVVDDKVIDFDSKITEQTLSEFVHQL